MRNLKIRRYSELAGISQKGRCELAEDVRGEIVLVCGRHLWRLNSYAGDDGDTGGNENWISVGQIFDFDDDEIISLHATFMGFCAVSKCGQIVTFQLKTLPAVETVCDIPGEITCVSRSPDLELLVVLISKGQLLLMREDFNIVVEQEVETHDLGEKSAITVGWGKKETQFHGSAGKQAQKVVAVQKKSIAEFDDGRPYVVWRNDGQYFATNTVHNDVRTIRIWSREGVLQYTAEAIPELHGGLAWRWGDENLITSVDTSPMAERRIVFYETNGLRHGEFLLPKGALVVKDIYQGTVGTARVLIVLYSEASVETENQEDVLILYIMNNYHWYPKQTLRFPEGVRAILWDSHETLRVLANNLHSYRWSFQVDATGYGQVASIDGSKVLVTDFSKLVIPPPMAQRKIIAPLHVNSVVLLETSVVLQLDDGSLAVSDADVVSELIVCSDRTAWTHLTRLTDVAIVAVSYTKGAYKMHRIHTASKTIDELAILPAAPECLCVYENAVHVKLGKEILRYDVNDGAYSATGTAMGPLEDLKCTPQGVFVGFNSSERTFYLNDRLVCQKASSFVIHGSIFVLVTTVDNTLECYPIFGDSSDCCEIRNLEIGSLLVTTAPLDGRVVLQMPRGNVETIYPRPLMLHAIQSYLLAENFDMAFRLMKINRINMNLFYDFAPNTFVTRIDAMVRKINDVNSLNLIIMELQAEDVTRTMYKGYYSLVERPRPKTKKNVLEICEIFRRALVDVDEESFLLSIITCYVKKNTMDDLETALLTANRFEVRFDEVVKYLLVLVDVNRLMDIALGTYDFKIFLKVAQHSQKDPKEYLALLKELKCYKSDDYRKFKIDTHLKRHDRALVHVAKCPDHFAECLDLVIKQRLFTKAHSLFPAESSEAFALWVAHGDYLLTKKYYKDAAIAYMQGRAYHKACQCFERSLCIDLCLHAARLANLPIEPIGERLVLALITENKYTEACSLMKRHNYPMEKICLTLVSGGCWEEAFCSLVGVPDDRQEYVRTELREQMLSNAQELRESVAAAAETFSRFVARLEIVREEKANRNEDYMNFYDDTDLPMSEAGSVASRTSANRSAKSGTTRSGSIITKQSNRQARKARKPKYTLKEGSPFEDLAIVQECFQLTKNLENLIQQVAPLVTGLQLLSLMEEAASLHAAFGSYYATVRDTYIPLVWPEVTADAAQVISDEELRVRPTLPEGQHASAIFADRW
ncbi:elongator complex protein 1-like [Tropilaelaps mercedesae]|uniref:Elongator complex protein 1 n=1 Tax=Tropilaelaps mercedesae TaxID=418985 RepID=A0A1V9XIY4_9ACAR|nr:elongator complex protein 1-like [Tropilaelaps mercedesae]